MCMYCLLSCLCVCSVEKCGESIHSVQSLRRRRHAHPLVVGIVSAVNSVPHMDPTAAAKPVEHNFSLCITSKDSML